jgi:serine protease AprX
MKETISMFSFWRRMLCGLFFGSGILVMLGAVASLPAIDKAGPNDRSNISTKIAPWVLREGSRQNQIEFLVVLADQADISGAKQLRTKTEKTHYVRDALWAKTQATQQSLLQWLRDHGIEHRSFYIVNSIWVKASIDIAKILALRPDVLRVEGNPKIRNVPDPLPLTSKALTSPNAVETIEPGISYTHAPQVWALGFTGQGIVVGGMDTGYRWDHNALKNKYRGWNGTSADHNYNWHDSIHSGGGSCGADSPAPCDDNGHGTHTMGTAVGDDGNGNQIGMAPGAKWIGCRNMDQGAGTPATYMECFEFFLAPYPVGGTPQQGDPSKAPDLTTNSWACPASEGCSANTLQAAVEAQRAAGIMTVVAAGNEGPSCSSVQDPPGIYDAAYSIGALTNGTDTIASFSSRGPVAVDNSQRLKPDLTAPGTNVRSSLRTTSGSYGNLSGTSMATPHVAGAVALLWSARPTLRHDIAATETILNNSAAHILSNECGSGPAVSPNNAYGFGRLDVKAAVDHLVLTGAVSRKSHGLSGTFDIPMPLTGEPAVECRSDVGNYTLVFTFDNNIMSGSASMTGGVGSVSGTPTFSGNTMTVNLTGVTDVQKITVTLTGVTDTLAQVLPDTAMSLNILAGDATGNKSVNASDVAQIKAKSGATLNATNFREDVTASGSINASDVSFAKARSGTSLP